MLELWFERIEAHDQGAPVSIDTTPIEEGGAYIKVKRMHTPEYYKYIEQQRSIKYSAFSPKTEQDEFDLITDWLGDVGITGWYGIVEPSSDTDLPFTRENCRRIVKSDAYKGLVTSLINEAANREAFLDCNIKSIEKALGKKLSAL